MKQPVTAISLNPTLIIILLSCLIPSCKDDNDQNAPYISLGNDPGYIYRDTSVAPGEVLPFRIRAAKGSNNLTQLYIQVITDQADIYFDTSMNTGSVDIIKKYTKTLAGEENWKFFVRDKIGRTAAYSLVVRSDTSGSRPTSRMPGKQQVIASE
ncbi:MAG: hypothetical protein R6T99_04825 [Bacteroidales bacterium]